MQSGGAADATTSQCDELKKLLTEFENVPESQPYHALTHSLSAYHGLLAKNLRHGSWKALFECLHARGFAVDPEISALVTVLSDAGSASIAKLPAGMVLVGVFDTDRF